MENFLSTEEHQRVLDFALAGEDGFGDSGVIDQHGRDQKDYGFRKSRTLSGSPLDAIWPLFDHRLRGILAYVRKELGVRWFPLGEVERQLTAHSGGGFFAPHVDTGHSLTVSRRISCVYYFHSSPRRFTGGELKLYDSWVTDGGSTAAPTCTTLTPSTTASSFSRAMSSTKFAPCTSKPKHSVTAGSRSQSGSGRGRCRRSLRALRPNHDHSYSRLLFIRPALCRVLHAASADGCPQRNQR